MYLDFFPNATQRSAVALAANLCKYAPSSMADIFAADLSTMKQLLEHDDARIVNSAMLAISRLIYSYQMSPNALSKLEPDALVSILRAKLMKKGGLTYF